MLNEFLLKYKKYIILITCFLIIFIVIYGISNTEGSKRKKVIKAITYSGFKLDADSDNLLYEKDIDNKTYEDYKKSLENKEKSSYKKLYFNPYTFELIENYFECDKGAEAILEIIYDYKSDKLNYTYTAKLDELNLIYTGKLSNKGFTCKANYDINLGPSNKEDFCCEIEKVVRKFNNERLKIITSTKILNYMKK